MTPEKREGWEVVGCLNTLTVTDKLFDLIGTAVVGTDQVCLVFDSNILLWNQVAARVIRRLSLAEFKSGLENSEVVDFIGGAGTSRIVVNVEKIDPVAHVSNHFVMLDLDTLQAYDLVAQDGPQGDECSVVDDSTFYVLSHTSAILRIVPLDSPAKVIKLKLTGPLVRQSQWWQANRLLCMFVHQNSAIFLLECAPSRRISSALVVDLSTGFAHQRSLKQDPLVAAGGYPDHVYSKGCVMPQLQRYYVIGHAKEEDNADGVDELWQLDLQTLSWRRLFAFGKDLYCYWLSASFCGCFVHGYMIEVCHQDPSYYLAKVRVSAESLHEITWSAIRRNFPWLVNRTKAELAASKLPNQIQGMILEWQRVVNSVP